MDHKTRATCIIIGCVIAIIAASLEPWFVIAYHPSLMHPIDGISPNTPNQYTFNALFLLPFIANVAFVTPLFIFIGLSFVIGLLALARWSFIEKIVLGKLKYLQVFMFFVTLIIDLFNKSIILNMNKEFLFGFYGTTDPNYILKNSTINIYYPGIILTILGVVITFLAIKSVTSEVTTTWGGVTVVVTSCVVILSIVLCAIGRLTIYPLLYNPEIGDVIYWSVSATQGWQDTQINITKGYLVCITYQSGTWTPRKGGITPSDANGKPAKSLKSQSGKLLQSVSSQALIGKVGNGAPFLVGDQKGFSASTGGELFLRINEDDASLKDGAGSVYVVIRQELPPGPNTSPC